MFVIPKQFLDLDNMGYVKYDLNLTIYGLPLRPNGVGGSILKSLKVFRLKAAILGL